MRRWALCLHNWRAAEDSAICNRRDKPSTASWSRHCPLIYITVLCDKSLHRIVSPYLSTLQLASFWALNWCLEGKIRRPCSQVLRCSYLWDIDSQFAMHLSKTASLKQLKCNAIREGRLVVDALKDAALKGHCRDYSLNYPPTTRKLEWHYWGPTD